MKLLLGSNSPRRSELLKSLNFDFEKVSIGTDEDFDGIETNKVARYLAKKKSLAYVNLSSNEVLITADTVVLAQNTILNKPASKAEAIEMLSILSGGKHLVSTGVCVRSLKNNVVFTETTEVIFEPIATSEMEFYIDNFKTFDKAGAYGIQEWIGMSKVKKIKGCFYNVMGLPTQKLYSILTSQFNIYPTNFGA